MKSDLSPSATDERKIQPSSQWKFWREARVMELEPYYCYWVSHLTSEGLHAKSDISTVLAILHQQRDEMQDDALRLHKDKMDLIDARLLEMGVIHDLGQGNAATCC